MKFVSDAIAAFIETPERRSGDERRLENIDVSSDRRSGDDRRTDFTPENIPRYAYPEMTIEFETFLRDHNHEMPLIVITDGKKIKQAPFKLLQDWFGYDFRKIENLSEVYLSPEHHAKIVNESQEKRFIRRMTVLVKANGERVPVDILVGMRTSVSGEKYYYCFIAVVD